ncbi:gliding motility lipoprotein GldH [Sphingobacterium wenxiniae]|uniref:Gliding motility-associated lipoprotein GldH n=1 Tax=Sphingobacterium wenxiniae TaxID=683125 RepID=A0A1I6SBD4_9SPHI|nr:gliding motility lipoprotein GldH [Sphingobacterium wenxiniae]SFS74281.1 gliding motility-associated lipoprotein GldH [Sphingobacterium wenxiniae]
MKTIGYNFLVIIFLMLTSCGDQAFYEKNEPIKNRSWAYNEIPQFEVHITDKNIKYDVFVNLRHTTHYGFSNLFVLVHEKGPQLRDTAFRHELKLAELDGRWTGKGAGSLFQNQLLIKENFTFPDTGVYHFAIEQNMRENPLKEISDVGLKIVQK